MIRCCYVTAVHEGNRLPSCLAFGVPDAAWWFDDIGIRRPGNLEDAMSTCGRLTSCRSCLRKLVLLWVFVFHGCGIGWSRNGRAVRLSGCKQSLTPAVIYTQLHGAWSHPWIFQISQEPSMSEYEARNLL